MNPTVWVGIIEWSKHDGDVEPAIYISTTRRTVAIEVIERLVRDWEQAPDLFYDDAPDFMAEHGRLDYYGMPFSVVSDELLDAWLDEFRESTTAPWASIIESEVLL